MVCASRTLRIWRTSGRQTFPYKTREELPVIRAESYAIASRLCARPPNHNFRCVFQKSLRSVFPTGDHGRHFFWLKAAAGEECEQIGQVGTRIGNSEEQSRGVEIHLRERKLRVLEEVVTNPCATAAGICEGNQK